MFDDYDDFSSADYYDCIPFGDAERFEMRCIDEDRAAGEYDDWECDDEADRWDDYDDDYDIGDPSF